MSAAFDPASHVDWLYGFFRMTLQTPAEAESALVATLAGAARRPPSDSPKKVLLRLALEELRARNARVLQQRRHSGPHPDAPRPLRGRGATPPPALLAGIGDLTLAALVRAQGRERRQALFLSLTCGLNDEVVAWAIGSAPADVSRLCAAGLAELAERVASYERETRRIGAMARENAHYLRPVRPPPSDGVIAVRGDRAYVDEPPPGSFLAALLGALERLLQRLLHGGGDPLDDDVGDPGKPRRSPPTAGTRELARPKRTPSMRGYRTPEPTPGMTSYAAPKQTPSTGRLSSSTRPLTAARGRPG